MAFNVNHGLIIKEFDFLSPNGEHLPEQYSSSLKQHCVPITLQEMKPKSVSSPKRVTLEDGLIYTYVVVNDHYIRIEKITGETKRLIIPSVIASLPVASLGADVYSEQEVVEEIVCAESIKEIGACAFRLCPNLRRIAFPEGLETYFPSWLQHCKRLAELKLPGELKTLKRSIFDNPSLKSLYIGRKAEEIEPGAFEKSELEHIEISKENPFLETDGIGIYSKNKDTLYAIAKPIESYEVLDGCNSVAKKAAKGYESLKKVILPLTLKTVEAFAFAHSGLVSIELPSSLEFIGERAFFHCQNLKNIILNEGLLTIDNSAFAESGLEALYIPSTVQTVGTSITEKTQIVHSGKNVTFAVSPDSALLVFDSGGGLYRKGQDGLQFIQLIDRDITEYSVLDGTTTIESYAFAFHNAIEQVILPEGVTCVGQSAFRICSNLKNVQIPSSLRFIGKEAFLDTSLEALFLPKGFEQMGEDALVTSGAHHLGAQRTLSKIEVEEGNEKFYVSSGILCVRGSYGDRAIAFTDAVSHVVIPDTVTSIAPFTFNNAKNIKELFIGPNLKTISSSGLSPWSMIELIHIETPEPEEDRSTFDIRFPNTERSIHEISLALGGSSWINVPEIYRHYDNCIAAAHDYHNNDGISPYIQAKLILARFNDPLFLTSVNRSIFERILRLHIIEICVDVARNDDRKVLNALLDTGYLTEDNLEDAIMAVGRLQDASITGYLLELKRLRFQKSAIDYDL